MNAVFYVSLLLWLLLIPLSVFAARGWLGGAATPLRRCCTVLHAFAIYGVMLYFLESAYVSAAPYAALAGESVEYLRYLETALISLYWLAALAARLFARFRGTRALGAVAIVLAHGVAGLLLNLYHEAEFLFTLLFVVAGALVCLLHWVNLLADPEKRLGHLCVILTNTLIFALTLGCLVWVLRQGLQMLEQTGVGTVAFLLVGAACVLILAPSALCTGSLAAAALRQANEEADEDDPAE